MAKASTYIQSIRAQVKADYNGKVPMHLDLTIRNYALALEMRDKYREVVMDKPFIVESGSMGQAVTKQNPLCSLLYQQEVLCLNYAKALGGTSAKAAMKIEPVDNVQEDDPMAKMMKEAQTALDG